jgi:hypothetical protein
MNQLQARLNGLSDHEYNEATEAANKREEAEERAARKAVREAKKKAQLSTLEHRQSVPSTSAAIAIPVRPDAPEDRDRYPVDVDP